VWVCVLKAPLQLIPLSLLVFAAQRMAPYRAAEVRDEGLMMLERLHRSRERKLGIELNELQMLCFHSPSNAELKHMWGLEAKVEAQFGFMRRLMRTEGFVMRTMADYDAHDLHGSNALDTQELQEFVKKRDGHQTKHTLVEARSQQLLSDLDVDRDGKVSRVEWLLYMAYLYWMSSNEETVVEKVVTVTKEHKSDNKGNAVMVESIAQHPGRTLPKPSDHNQQNQQNMTSQQRSNQQTNQQRQGHDMPYLDKVREHINRTQQQSGSLLGKATPVVESVRQNPDGSTCHTFEHNHPVSDKLGMLLP